MAPKDKPDSESGRPNRSARAALPSQEEFDACFEKARQNVKSVAKAETAGEQIGEDILNFRLRCNFDETRSRSFLPDRRR
jgi:hypothetical protein